MKVIDAIEDLKSGVVVMIAGVGVVGAVKKVEEIPPHVLGGTSYLVCLVDGNVFRWAKDKFVVLEKSEVTFHGAISEAIANVCKEGAMAAAALQVDPPTAIALLLGAMQCQMRALQ